MKITDFRKHLKVVWESTGIPFPPSGDEMRVFKAIPCRHGLHLSIQASSGNYCWPRKTLSDLSQYEAWEIALIGKEIHSEIKGIGVNFAPMMRLSKLSKFREHIYDEDDVAPYVPTRVVQQILDTLRR